MVENETWVTPDFGDTSLADRYNQIAAIVKEKTSRVMQIKDRERANKTTGKVSMVRGSTLLKEGMVVIKEDMTMEQLQRFCEVCKERWGITTLKSSSIVMRGITVTPKTLPVGSPIFTPISSGIG